MLIKCNFVDIKTDLDTNSGIALQSHNICLCCIIFALEVRFRSWEFAIPNLTLFNLYKLENQYGCFQEYFKIWTTEEKIWSPSLFQKMSLISWSYPNLKFETWMFTFFI